VKKPTACDCEEAFRRLGDYLDRELSAEEIEMVKAHLALCQTCAMEFHFEEALLIELKAKARQAAAPPELLESILQTLDCATGPETPQ
jgi:anti-sigma factor (TIGR02949 family)